jgi:hypothetical protein
MAAATGKKLPADAGFEDKDIQKPPSLFSL